MLTAALGLATAGTVLAPGGTSSPIARVMAGDIPGAFNGLVSNATNPALVGTAVPLLLLTYASSRLHHRTGRFTRFSSHWSAI